jgi:hypothetical protein
MMKLDWRGAYEASNTFQHLNPTVKQRENVPNVPQNPGKVRIPLRSLYRVGETNWWCRWPVLEIPKPKLLPKLLPELLPPLPKLPLPTKQRDNEFKSAERT